MALADKLTPTKRSIRQDKVLAAMDQMTQEDRAVLIDALKRVDDFSNPDITKALAAEGYQVNANQVANLRRKMRDGEVTL